MAKLPSETTDQLRKQCITDLKGAIKELTDLVDRYDQDTLILLSGRLSRLQQENIRGTLSFPEFIRSQTGITADFLDILSSNSLETETTKSHIPSPAQPIKDMNPYEEKLLAIMRETKRRDKATYEKAEILLEKLRKHADQKKTDPTYDLKNRLYNEIVADIKLFFTEQDGAETMSLEAFVNQIDTLLEEDAPSYPKLQEAYDLCQGRNLCDPKVERILKAQSPERLARIECAEAIERLIATLV